METKNCQNCKNDFVVENALVDMCQKVKVSVPNICFDCRMTRIMAYVNMRSLYKRECGLCKKSIVTMYSPESPSVVYCNDCWNGDGWEGSEYGFKYDSSKLFIEQWFELYKKVPRPILRKVQMVDSEYTNFSVQGNHCYFGYSVLRSEYIRYSENIDDSKNCMDSLCLKACEWCYENVDSNKNYNCVYIAESKSCIDSRFLFDCSNCQDCFMSAQLRNKKYVFRGEQLTKEEYAEAIQKEELGSYSHTENLKKEFVNLCKSSIHKYADITNSLNSTGNHILNSKNVTKSFFVTDGENIVESLRVPGTKDLLNCVYIAGSESLYACMGCSLGSYQVRNSLFCMGSKDVDYSAFCINCQDVFGCVGLKNKKYCIFNTQYEKEEYFKLIEEIKFSMSYTDKAGRVYTYGDFYPGEFSPFTYNETIAQEYFPKSEYEVIKEGFNPEHKKTRSYNINCKAGELPDEISEVDVSITTKIIECEHKGECKHQCTTAFRILLEDLEFYKKMNLPLPRICPNCRYYERLSKRAPAKLWHRDCMCKQENHEHVGKCQNEFETSYAPDRPEIVYCESCYQKEVV